MRGLLRKEVCEVAPIALVGLALMVYAVRHDGIGQALQQAERLPFESDNLAGSLRLYGLALAVALGWRQSWAERRQATWPCLFTRPVARQRVIQAKLACGVLALLLTTTLPLLYYAWWAACPGHHASPFFWDWTWDSWLTCAALVPVYLGVFIAGLRPTGTALGGIAFAVGNAALAVLVCAALSYRPSNSLAAMAIWSLLLVAAGRQVVRSADLV